MSFAVAFVRSLMSLYMRLQLGYVVFSIRLKVS